MYISINKKWFEENKKQIYENTDDKESIIISVEESKVELQELTDEGLFISDSNDDVCCSLTYKPNTETIVGLVENEIDNIKGEALTKIVELVVKKLNKFKSLIESVRGL